MAVIQQYALLIENECGERVERERERERGSTHPLRLRYEPPPPTKPRTI